MSYAIAQYFTEAERRYATSLTYRQQALSVVRRARGRICPIGACLNAHGLIAASPTPKDVAAALARYNSQEWADIEIAARIFMSNWDSGIITDLAAALGVNEPAPPAGEEGA